MGSDQQWLALVSGKGAHQFIQLVGFDAESSGAFVDESKRGQMRPHTRSSWKLGETAASGEVTVSGTQLFLPRESGVMSIYEGQSLRCSARVGSAPLRKAIVGKSKEYFVTADQGGQFCAVALKLP
jgi:hypothetical protein